jgi:hypothetical protein
MMKSERLRRALIEARTFTQGAERDAAVSLNVPPPCSRHE